MHSLCCALSEATTGNNRAKEVIHACCAVSDSSACMEAVGLLDSQPDLRTPDILMRVALPNRLAALDVGIKCPEASGAGLDCAETMVEEKLDYYAGILHELERKGIIYAPIAFSCFGQCHGTTSKIMASRAARFRGQLDYKQMLKWWHATVTTELWRRAARMVKAPLQKPGRFEQVILEGENAADDDPDLEPSEAASHERPPGV